MQSVVVFGATGFTGRLVVRSLLDQGVTNIVLGGRSEARLAEQSRTLGGLPYRVADAAEASSLPGLVADARVVISTAGPFTRFGEPVVRAALAAGAHFLDTTGEQGYMARVLERYHGAAVDKRVAIVNAHAFEFALGCCAAALLAESDTTLHTIDVFNRVYGFGATRGTQESGIDQILSDAWERKRGRLVQLGKSPFPRWVTWPDSGKREPAVPFPGAEALQLVRTHPEVLNVSTNLAVPKSVVAPLMAAWSARAVLRGAEKLGALEPVRRFIRSLPEGPSEEARDRAGFKVLARGQSDSATRSVLVKGTDPYGITGVIAALGAKLLLARPPRATGVVSTDQAFGARAFLEALAPFGVTWSEY